MPTLPTGTVTFLFTDVEGSTKLLRDLGPNAYADALAEHRRVVRDAVTAHGGAEVDTQGDAFFVAFPTAHGALATADAVRQGLAAGPIRVRMGMHTGMPHLTDEGYVGDDVHRAARIAAAGHGGQVLVSAATVALVGTDGLRELGEHRFKDFAEPIAIYQLGNERFPPLKTISNTNLPRPASSFIGREREVDEVAAQLRDGARLLTLTGPGGSGKTRLAIEVAADLIPEFKAGVFWVGLAALRDAAVVAETIGQTIGAKDGLAVHIGEREMLLLIDNLEQVIEAAPGLAVLVEACPNLRLMITSRELLRVRGEVEFAVLPLAEVEAIELFQTRSHLAPDPAIGELCRRLDNLPLAVELAAARTAVLTPSQILDRLGQRLDLLKGGRDAEARQRTLRSTIEWSYELLTADEQRLFARMAVFAGGCSLESAIEVADADLDTLQSLVDKSLVRHTDERFWMLETVREFAVERFGVSSEVDVIRRRHFEHYNALAAEAERYEMVEGVGSKWVDRLELEIDNLRAALDVAELVDTQRALRMAASVSEVWDRRGHHAEGLARLSRMLESDRRPTSARAWALNALSQLASRTGDLEGAMSADDDALAIHRSLGDRRGEAVSLWGIGYLHIEQGNPREAERYCRAAVDLFRETGDAAMLRWTLRTLGFAYLRLGDLERSRIAYGESLELARVAGDKELAAGALGGLVGVAQAEGMMDQAAEHALEGLSLVGDSRDVLMKTARVVVAADVAAKLGRFRDALRLVAYARAQYADLGAVEPWVEADIAEIETEALEELGDAGFTEASEAGRRLTTEAAFSLARQAIAIGQSG